MKKTQKKVLGTLGLLGVASMTVFAACLPPIEAHAVTSSITDNITIRVVGSEPLIRVTGIESGSETVTPGQNINIEYENIDQLNATITYIDADGNEHQYPLLDIPADYQAGGTQISFDLDNGAYVIDGVPHTLPESGYGKYIIDITGEGYDGVRDEKHIEFEYLPVLADATLDDRTGNVTVDLVYDPDNTTDGGDPTDQDSIKNIVISVYDKNGNLVTPLLPVTVTPPDTSVVLPFDEYNLSSGTYTIEVIAYNQNDEILYKEYYTTVVYSTYSVPSTGGSTAGTPDTGGLFSGLNIAKGDYLATGLLIFFIVGGAGLYFISRKDKKSSKRR